MTIREALHELVDGLPEAVLADAENYLRELQFEPHFKAPEEWPEDDEPVTDEDIALWNLRLEEARRGKVTPHEEVLRIVERYLQ